MWPWSVKQWMISCATKETWRSTPRSTASWLARDLCRLPALISRLGTWFMLTRQVLSHTLFCFLQVSLFLTPWHSLLQDQRLPADMIFMRTTERSGTCFIRTDQLDGETDWKLRIAVATTQHLSSDAVSALDISHWYAHIWHSALCYTFISDRTSSISRPKCMLKPLAKRFTPSLEPLLEWVHMLLAYQSAIEVSLLYEIL